MLKKSFCVDGIGNYIHPAAGLFPSLPSRTLPSKSKTKHRRVSSSTGKIVFPGLSCTKFQMHVQHVGQVQNSLSDIHIFMYTYMYVHVHIDVYVTGVRNAWSRFSSTKDIDLV